MKILVAGGTGLIGNELIRSLVKEGHSITLLSRSKRKFTGPHQVKVLHWDGIETKGWGEIVEDVDSIINLAGRNIGSFPWTKRKMEDFRFSRVYAGQALVRAIRDYKAKPKSFIQASATGYYGPRKKDPVDESSEQGNDFSARLCVEWEDSTKEIEDWGIRRIILRTGIVLSDRGGVLPLMVLPVKMFLGGSLGSGDQGIPWIHLADEVNAIKFLLSSESAQGAYNLCAPNPVANSIFMKTVAEVLNRPYWFHVPSWLIQFFLGGMSTLLLDGKFMFPAKLLENGFNFKYNYLKLALNDLLK